MVNPVFLSTLAILETAGGAKTIKGPNGEDSNNLYNIKDFSGKGFRAHDKAEGSRDTYRVYRSKEEADADLISLLERKYPKALNASNIEEFAAALKEGGYATDPNYVQKLTSVYNTRVAPQQVARLTQAGYDETIKEARARGYTDAEIAARLGDVKLEGQMNDVVAKSAARGEGLASQLYQLQQLGFADTIKEARARGYTDAEIVSRLADAGSQAGNAALAKREERGTLGNIVQGATNQAKDYAAGASQIYSRVTGDDEGLKRKQEEAAARQNDLDRISLEATGAGKTGALLTDVAVTAPALLIPGGPLGVVGRSAVQGAAAGAGLGALTPTTEDGQFVSNVVTGAGVGAAAGAGVVGGGKILKKAYHATGKTLDDFRARPAANAVAKAEEDRLLQQRLLSDAGVTGDRITHETVQAVKDKGAKLINDALDTNSVALTDDVVGELQLLSGAREVADKHRVRVTDLLNDAKDGPVSLRRLDDIYKSMRDDLKGQGLDDIQRKELGRLADAVKGLRDAELTRSGAKTSFDAGKDAYRKSYVLDEMVVRMNDTGEGAVKALPQAAKAAGNRNQFKKGNAPYQQLVRELESLPDVERGNVARVADTLSTFLSSPTGRLVTTMPMVRGGAAAAAKILSSLDKPAVREWFYSLNPVDQGAIKQLAAKTL